MADAWAKFDREMSRLERSLEARERRGGDKPRNRGKQNAPNIEANWPGDEPNDNNVIPLGMYLEPPTAELTTRRIGEDASALNRAFGRERADDLPEHWADWAEGDNAGGDFQAQRRALIGSAGPLDPVAPRDPAHSLMIGEPIDELPTLEEARANTVRRRIGRLDEARFGLEPGTLGFVEPVVTGLREAVRDRDFGNALEGLGSAILADPSTGRRDPISRRNYDRVYGAPWGANLPGEDGLTDDQRASRRLADQMDPSFLGEDEITITASSRPERFGEAVGGLLAQDSWETPEARQRGLAEPFRDLGDLAVDLWTMPGRSQEEQAAREAGLLFDYSVSGSDMDLRAARQAAGEYGFNAASAGLELTPVGLAGDLASLGRVGARGVADALPARRLGETAPRAVDLPAPRDTSGAVDAEIAPPEPAPARRFEAALRDPETGQIYTGVDHVDAIESAPDGVRERLDAIYRAPSEDPNAVGFVVNGQFMSREDGLQALRASRRPVRVGEQVNRDGSVTERDPIDWDAPIAPERSALADMGIGRGPNDMQPPSINSAQDGNIPPRRLGEARVATPQEVARTGNWDNYRFASEFTEDPNAALAQDIPEAENFGGGPRRPLGMPSSPEAGGGPTRHRRTVIDMQTRRGEPVTIIVNPSREDIIRMTRVPRGAESEAWQYDTLRYMSDADGNVYVANGARVLHDDMARALQDRKMLPRGYEFEAAAYDGHGSNISTGTLRRSGETITSNHPQIFERGMFASQSPTRGAADATGMLASAAPAARQGPPSLQPDAIEGAPRGNIPQRRLGAQSENLGSSANAIEPEAGTPTERGAIRLTDEQRAALTPDQSYIIERRLQGADYATIADEMGSDPRTLAVQVSKARRRLETAGVSLDVPSAPMGRQRGTGKATDEQLIALRDQLRRSGESNLRGGVNTIIAERFGMTPNAVASRISKYEARRAGGRPTASITDDPSGAPPEGLDTTPSVNDPVSMRMERARRLGFDVDRPLYHGTRGDFREFRPSEDGLDGPGIYLTDNPKSGSDYAARDWIDNPDGTETTIWADGGNVMPVYARNAQRVGNDTFLVERPQDVRSRFAAFDPARTNESDILAGVGAGGIIGAGLYFGSEASAQAADEDGILQIGGLEIDTNGELPSMRDAVGAPVVSGDLYVQEFSDGSRHVFRMNRDGERPTPEYVGELVGTSYEVPRVGEGGATFEPGMASPDYRPQAETQQQDDNLLERMLPAAAIGLGGRFLGQRLGARGAALDVSTIAPAAAYDLATNGSDDLAGTGIVSIAPALSWRLGEAALPAVREAMTEVAPSRAPRLDADLEADPRFLATRRAFAQELQMEAPRARISAGDAIGEGAFMDAPHPDRLSPYSEFMDASPTEQLIWMDRLGFDIAPDPARVAAGRDIQRRIGSPPEAPALEAPAGDTPRIGAMNRRFRTTLDAATPRTIAQRAGSRPARDVLNSFAESYGIPVGRSNVETAANIKAAAQRDARIRQAMKDWGMASIIGALGVGAVATQEASAAN